MALEPVNVLDDLIAANPTDTDPVSEGDNHIRNVKKALAAGVTGDAVNTRLLSGAVVKGQVTPDGFEALGTLLDLKSAVDAALSIRMLNSDTPDLGAALVMAAATGLLTLRETDGAGVLGNTFASFTRGAGVGLRFGDLEKFVTLDKGVGITGQAVVSDPAPLNPDELARKDYVDGEISTLNTSLLAAIAVVQADLDNVKNGFAFTGAISAPVVTEV